MAFAITRRKFVTLGAQTAAAAAASRFLVVEALGQAEGSKYAGVFAQLDHFVELYMRNMNAPGMTLVMADRDGVQRVATYGFSDLELKTPVKAGELFEIGSISKSFIANCILQLNQEGKLDLHKPVAEYLPWWRIESSFAPITTHHMLTHTTGLPGIPPVFLSDPAAKHRAAHAPGEYFHYNNMVFTTLGHLLWMLDGRTLPEVIRGRVLHPLGMTQTEPVISLDIRSKTAKNHEAFLGDRPYPRNGRLAEAPAIIMTDGAGCVASTAYDMGLYIQMIANRGAGPKGKLLTEESFGLFSKAHIKAEEFGPTASYGYGIAVDTLAGHTILRHTGGMVSFASAMQVDIDEGVGVFASINAMQGYRPNPVAQLAIQLMRAQKQGQSLPAPPALKPPDLVENAGEYAGNYEADGGRKFDIVADGPKIFLVQNGNRIALESRGGDAFLVMHQDWERYALIFGRADEKDPKSVVVEAGWGSEWFTNSKYTGPKTFAVPKEWSSYVGHYRNESAWIGSLRVVVRKGKLMIDGETPLEPGDGGIFYLRDEEHSPEWIRFADIVNGKAMHLKLSGEDLWRVMTA
jgi:CubicO group peptidase (beta-lactamase class C family)